MSGIFNLRSFFLFSQYRKPEMQQTKRKNRLFLFLIFFMIFQVTAAQTEKKKTGHITGAYFTGKTGISFLVTEIFKGFSGSANEFTNQPGPHIGFEISRFLTPQLEAGADVSFSWLKGVNNSPHFSAIGLHACMMDPITEPVEYNNRLYGPKIFTRFYFPNNSKKENPANVYLKTGFGILFYESELFYRYRTNDQIIFGKGYGKFKTTKVSNAVYVLGSGFTRAIAERVNLNASVNLNFVNYDFLDVVHNFDTSGKRRQITGLFSDVSIGISVNLDKSMVTFNQKVKKADPVEYMPFYKK